MSKRIRLETHLKSIKTLLNGLGLVDEKTLEIFSHRTRDNEKLLVLKDKLSGIIFIDGYVPDVSTYTKGMYRDVNINFFGSRDYEILNDLNRRLNDYNQYYIGKDVLEFGCGEGSFLKAINDKVKSCVGIELQEDYINHLNDIDIRCSDDLEAINDETLDSIFCLHTLEHLENPIKVLKEFRKKLRPGGHAIVEVPHANDFLLKDLNCLEFKDFTLWSQHLILHTRKSLEVFFKEAGFTNILIQGKQRYKLSNHLNWLRNGSPGGHKKSISSIDTPSLTQAYESALQMVDRTDTLIAIISKG